MSLSNVSVTIVTPCTSPADGPAPRQFTLLLPFLSKNAHRRLEPNGESARSRPEFRNKPEIRVREQSSSPPRMKARFESSSNRAEFRNNREIRVLEKQAATESPQPTRSTPSWGRIRREGHEVASHVARHELIVIMPISGLS